MRLIAGTAAVVLSRVNVNEATPNAADAGAPCFTVVRPRTQLLRPGKMRRHVIYVERRSLAKRSLLCLYVFCERIG